MTPLFLASAALYGLSTAALLLHVFGRREGMLRVGRWSLALALLAHLGFIGWQCMRGMNPLRDIHGALGLSGWLLALGYLICTVRSRFAVIGALIAPASLALLTASRLTPAGPTVLAAARAGALGRVHIALAACGVAVFGIAAAVAVIYLLQEAALKSRRVRPLYRHTPSLSSLDRAGRRLILVGFPIFTLAVMSGLMWITRLPGAGGLRVEHAISGATWTIFAGLILARVTVGLRGRGAALLTIIGFVAVLAVLLVYTSRRMLGG